MNILASGMMIILSSPSGAGKTTIIKKLLSKNNNLHLSISVTTRNPRLSEVNGIDYNFISQSEFDQMLLNDQLLEHANVFGNSYGTDIRLIDAALQENRDIIFDIDWQGAKQLTSKIGNIISIFILPPSIAELEKRLQKRNQDSKEEISSRMKKAKNEISHWHEYDYVLINQDIEATVLNIQNIIQSEKLKKKYNFVSIERFITNML